MIREYREECLFLVVECGLPHTQSLNQAKPVTRPNSQLWSRQPPQTQEAEKRPRRSSPETSIRIPTCDPAAGDKFDVQLSSYILIIALVDSGVGKIILDTEQGNGWAS
ncbi:hypothetical protein OIDMADRAFT_176802 [Oidiodendron maius Zn]|uniref:Uncharacterized protein n=1 Tax=Oidiodendron maius (strain Zn) TaxID=913774 RepID=A0A0C3HMW8_OIDMZ|nr:hypothetical protein OIDMADRAFT_176802 [Oidiodendron maius Zn]